MSDYFEFLKKNIFKTNEYLQFELLLNDLKNIRKKKSVHYGIIERSYLYGGRSIFYPLFEKSKKVTIFSYEFSKFEKSRKSTQIDWIKKTNYNFKQFDYKVVDKIGKIEFNFKNKDCEFILIPNIVHHCSNFNQLITKIKKQFNKLKYIYIFDSSIRETHQFPYDFERQTPSSIDIIMKKNGLHKIYNEEIGNVFDVMLYVISQSKKILSNSSNNKINSKIRQLEPLLIEKRSSKKWRNLGRKYAKLYTAYSMIYKVDEFKS